MGRHSQPAFRDARSAPVPEERKIPEDEVYTREKDSETDPVYWHECPICLATLAHKVWRVMPCCGNVFGSSCLEEHLRLAPQKKCPKCREPIRNSKSCPRIYLPDVHINRCRLKSEFRPEIEIEFVESCS